MRVKIDWRSSSKENYISFCKKNPSIKISFDEWKNIIYLFNESFKNYILETGERAKLPFGFVFLIENELTKELFVLCNFNIYIFIRAIFQNIFQSFYLIY